MLFDEDFTTSQDRRATLCQVVSVFDSRKHESFDLVCLFSRFGAVLLFFSLGSFFTVPVPWVIFSLPAIAVAAAALVDDSSFNAVITATTFGDSDIIST